MDDIAEALDGDHKLNLTADQNDAEDEAINKKCENFLNSLKGEGNQNVETDQLLKQFQGIMGNILEGINPSNQEQQKAFQETFEKLEQTPQFDELADKMLLYFMDKDLLEQPMKETYEAYSKFVKDNQNKLNEEELKKYQKQKDCIEKIIHQLNNNPNDKEKFNYSKIFRLKVIPLWRFLGEMKIHQTFQMYILKELKESHAIYFEQYRQFIQNQNHKPSKTNHLKNIILIVHFLFFIMQLDQNQQKNELKIQDKTKLGYIQMERLFISVQK